MTDHIIQAAKAAGGTTYTNRHYPDAPAAAFGPEALARFYAIAFAAGMERAAEICEAFAGTSAARIAALEAEVAALRKDAAKASDLQSLIDWMVPNHDLVYHAVGATGEGFVERVRQYMAQAAIRAAIEAERGEG